MDANFKESLTAKLKRSLKERKVSVPEFEAQTGIPKDRVYKWLKRATDNIGYEDATTIEKWMSEKMDNSPKELEVKGRTIHGENKLIDTILDLTYTSKKNADGMDKMADANLINARSIETLVKILAANLSGSGVKGISLEDLQKGDVPAEAFLNYNSIKGQERKGSEDKPQKKDKSNI